MKLYKIIYLFLGLAIISSSCQSDDDDSIQAILTPSNLSIEAQISGATSSNLFGDRSGKVTFNFSADDATFFEINFGDGNITGTSNSSLIHIYEGSANEKNFVIKITAFNGSESISKTINISIDLEYEDSTPSNLTIEAQIEGATSSNPNGDGSGKVTFNFSADDTSYFKIEFGDSETIETSVNSISHTYQGSGTGISYSVTITAYNGTESISKTIDISIDVLWTLVWSDEFDGNGAINSTNWFHQTQLPAGGGWYNNEVQHYTNRTDNSYVSNGTLKIVAKKEQFTDQGYTKQYTSARLNSKFAFTYGRVEISAKLPTGVGTWPAIWMLGKSINEDGGYWDIQGFGTTSWPACGEVDIMEHWGSNQNFVQSAMHTPSSYGGTVNHGGQTISTVSSQFHTYELEWSSEKMIFSVDGNVHYTYNPTTKDSSTWPFNAEQYILLNIAIEPSIAGSFSESSMEIEYIRVYQ